MPIEDSFSLELPADAQFLTLELQNNWPMLWFMMDKDAERVYKHFCIVGTGQEMPIWYGVRLKYLGTIQIDGFVWHLFQKHVVETAKSDHAIDAMGYLMQGYK